MPEDKQSKSETSNKGTSAKSDTTARVVKTIPEGYKKEVRDGKTVYVLKKEVPGGGGERSTSDTTGKKTIKPPVITKKIPAATTTISTPPVKPKPKPKDKTTPPTETIIPKEEPEKKYVEDILTLEEPTPPVKAPVSREIKGEANIYRRINNAASDANQTTYDYADDTGNITNKAIRRSFVGDKEVDPNFPFYDEKGNPNPTFIKGSNLNQGANVGTLTNYIMPGDASANTNVEGFKGNLGSAGFGITKNATGGLGVTNYANTPNTFVPPTYDAKGNKIGGGIMYDKTEADKANAIPGSAGKFNLQGDVTPESIMPTVPVPPIEKKAKGGVVGYATGGAVAYNSNGQGIDRFGNVISKKDYGLEQAGSAALTGLTGIAANYKKSQTPTTPQGATPTTPQNPSAPTTGAAGAAGASKSTGMSAGQASSIAGVGSLAAGIGASAIDSKNKDARGRYTSTEAAVGSSALKGAGMGAQIGMAAGPQGALIGAGIGAVAGAGYGLYKGDKDKKAISTSKTKMASELSTANVKTEQQLAMANRDAGIEGGRKANLITKDQAMYDENDNLINPVQYAAKGGTIVGKGGPKSDSIFTNSKDGIKPGSFIVPAEKNHLAKKLREEVLGDDPNRIAKFKKTSEVEGNIAVSSDEQLLTPEEKEMIVAAKGPGILKMLAPNAEENKESKMVEAAQGGLLGTLTDRENMREYKKGGLTSNKAKMMLHDGTINGKPITEQQRKYFGLIASGGKETKAEGGDVFGGNKNGGKIMAPKMMYADGTPPDGVNPDEEIEKIKKQTRDKYSAISKNEQEKKALSNAEERKQALKDVRAEKTLNLSKAAGRLKIAEDEYNSFLNEAKIGGVLGYTEDNYNAEKIKRLEGIKKAKADQDQSEKEYKQWNSTSKVSAPKVSSDSTTYSNNGSGDLLSKKDSTATPPVTTAPPTDASTTGSTTTRGVVKGGSSKVKPGKLTAEVMQPKNIALSTLEQEREAGIQKQMIEGEKSVLGTTERVKAQSEAENKARQDADAAAKAKKNATQSKLSQALSGINTEALIGAGQSALGYNMLKGEKRPGYKFELDPAYQASVERQKQEAGYGLSAEQRAMANQDIANALSDTRYSARNFAGGNAGTAFGQETMAINEGWRNKLGLISKDQELRMAKQQISDQSLKERAGIMTGAKREAYLDAKGRFDEIQAAGSELVGAGIRNVIGSTRLNKELEAMKAAKAKEDAYLGTVAV